MWAAAIDCVLLSKKTWPLMHDTRVFTGPDMSFDIFVFQLLQSLLHGTKKCNDNMLIQIHSKEDVISCSYQWTTFVHLKEKY